MRIAGGRIPDEKRLVIALTYIYGVGPKRAAELCEKAKIDVSVRVKDLTTPQEDTLRKLLDGQGWDVEADLRRSISLDVKRLQDIGSYRGFRHRRRLPSRGQRTKTNARTRRGRKSAAVAGKKKVTK